MEKERNVMIISLFFYCGARLNAPGVTCLNFPKARVKYWTVLNPHSWAICSNDFSVVASKTDAFSTLSLLI